MTMPKKFTRAVGRQITKDWHELLPSLGIYATRHLLRRVGSMLVGICLDRDSSGEIYEPCFHVHFLGMEFSCVALVLRTRLRSERSGAPDFIEVRWHEKKYREAVERMIRQSLLPLEGDLHIKQVLKAYSYYMKAPFGTGSIKDATLYRDMVHLSAWAGDAEGAKKLLKKALSALGQEEDSYRHVGGREHFEEQSMEFIERPELIHKIVEEQIIALKVDKLPVSNLIVD